MPRSPVNWKRLDRGNVISRLHGDPAEQKVCALTAAGETSFRDHADSSGEAGWRKMGNDSLLEPLPTRNSHRPRRTGRAQRLGKKS